MTGRIYSARRLSSHIRCFAPVQRRADPEYQQVGSQALDTTVCSLLQLGLSADNHQVHHCAAMFNFLSSRWASLLELVLHFLWIGHSQGQSAHEDASS